MTLFRVRKLATRRDRLGNPEGAAVSLPLGELLKRLERTSPTPELRGLRAGSLIGLCEGSRLFAIEPPRADASFAAAAQGLLRGVTCVYRIDAVDDGPALTV